MKDTVQKYHASSEDILAEDEKIRRAQNDASHFAPLYNAYYFRVLSFIYRRVESRDIAAEVTAQTFYKAMDNLHRYENKGLPFSSWLFRIASNELNQLFRRSKLKRTVSLDEASVMNLADAFEETSSTELIHTLKNALQCLSLEELEIIDLRYFDNRSFAEICEILDIKESAAKMKVHRSLKKLKEEFKRTGNGKI